MPGPRMASTPIKDIRRHFLTSINIITCMSQQWHGIHRLRFISFDKVPSGGRAQRPKIMVQSMDDQSTPSEPATRERLRVALRPFCVRSADGRDMISLRELEAVLRRGSASLADTDVIEALKVWSGIHSSGLMLADDIANEWSATIDEETSQPESTPKTAQSDDPSSGPSNSNASEGAEADVTAWSRVSELAGALGSTTAWRMIPRLTRPLFRVRWSARQQGKRGAKQGVAECTQRIDKAVEAPSLGLPLPQLPSAPPLPTAAQLPPSSSTPPGGVDPALLEVPCAVKHVTWSPEVKPILKRSRTRSPRTPPAASLTPILGPIARITTAPLVPGTSDALSALYAKDGVHPWEAHEAYACAMRASGPC